MTKDEDSEVRYILPFRCFEIRTIQFELWSSLIQPLYSAELTLLHCHSVQ